MLLGNGSLLDIESLRKKKMTHASTIKHRIASVLAAVALVAITLPASAVVITFEELGPRTCCFASEPPLTNQYAAQGVNFDGNWEVLNQSGGFGVNALSGEHFAAFNTSVTTNTLVMDFDQAIADISGNVGGGFAGNWVLEWFANNISVGSSSFSNLGGQYANFSQALGNDVTRVTLVAIRNSACSTT